MAEGCRVYDEPEDVAGRLDELGITETALVAAVREGGLTFASTCTAHDPPSLGGTLLWGKTVRKLRDDLVPRGWKISNARNYALTIRPDGRLGIVVAAGEGGVGIGSPEVRPSTKYVKGPATRDAVAANQLSFVDLELGFENIERELIPGVQTWFLLHEHYVDRAADVDELRLEFSLPSGVTDEGYVRAWRERIMLGAIPLDGESLRLGGQPDEPTPEIEIDIERRAAG